MECLTPPYSLSLIDDQHKTHWDKGFTPAKSEELLTCKAGENFPSYLCLLCVCAETKHPRRGSQTWILWRVCDDCGSWAAAPALLGLVEGQGFILGNPMFCFHSLTSRCQCGASFRPLSLLGFGLTASKRVTVRGCAMLFFQVRV